MSDYVLAAATESIEKSCTQVAFTPQMSRVRITRRPFDEKYLVTRLLCAQRHEKSVVGETAGLLRNELLFCSDVGANMIGHIFANV